MYDCHIRVEYFKLSLLDSLLQPCVGVGQRDQLVCIVK